MPNKLNNEQQWPRKTNTFVNNEPEGQTSAPLTQGDYQDRPDMVNQTADTSLDINISKPPSGKLEDIFTPEAVQKAVADGAAQGKDPQTSLEEGEYEIWNAPVEQSAQEFKNILKSPEKADGLAQGIDAAKKSGSQGGVGIIPTIFAGLAGAFDGGGKRTSELLNEWNPETQERQRVKDRAAVRKAEFEDKSYGSQEAEFAVASEKRDPKSELSTASALEAGQVFTAMKLPDLAGMVEGKSFDQIEKTLERFAPAMKQQYEMTKAKVMADAKLEQNTIGNDQAQQQIDETGRQNVIGNQQNERDFRQGQFEYQGNNAMKNNALNSRESENLEKRLNSNEQAQLDRDFKLQLQQMANEGKGAKLSPYAKAEGSALGREAPKREQTLRALEGETNKLSGVMKLFNNYSTQAFGGTGWASTLGGLKKWADSDTETLDKAFASVTLDTVKAFAAEAGAKAMDSNAERAALKDTVPKITNDDRTNAATLLGMQSVSEKGLQYAREKEAYVSTNQTMNGFSSNAFERVAMYDPNAPVGTAPQLVEQGSPELEQLTKQGYLGTDAMIDYVTGDKTTSDTGGTSDVRKSADAILGL